MNQMLEEAGITKALIDHIISPMIMISAETVKANYESVMSELQEKLRMRVRNWRVTRTMGLHPVHFKNWTCRSLFCGFLWMAKCESCRLTCSVHRASRSALDASLKIQPDRLRVLIDNDFGHCHYRYGTSQGVPLLYMMDSLDVWNDLHPATRRLMRLRDSEQVGLAYKLNQLRLKV